jgi:murein DD-endopeptidase MepM/ murein hydrolase activator NlpD
MNKYFLTILFILLSSLSVLSQTIKELEERRARTEKELNESTQLLHKTEKEREQSSNHLNILKRQLTLRRNLISDIQKQIELLEKEISNKSEMDILVFIFSSADFNQAYRRMRFYQQFLRFREKQAKEIINTQKTIKTELQQVSKNRNQLAINREEKETEINNLDSQEKKYAQTLRQLQQREQQLRKEVEKRKNAMAALDKAIEELIAEEAKKSKTQVRDARYLRISEGFAGNKGRLPWPTTTGVIVSEFGEHNHPVLKGVKIRNNGVDISTKLNEKVNAIFEGQVKKIVSIPGQNLAVLIRHGDFFTVYSNLVKIQVKVGEFVKAQQPIGEVYSEEAPGSAVFNLQIWKENVILDPTQWILP